VQEGRLLLIVSFEDRDWELSLDRLTYRQAMAIQLETGLSIAEFEAVLDVDEDENGNLADPGPKWLQCIGCVYWLMHQQAGDVFPLASMDFDFTGFLEAMGAAMQAELDRIKAERAAAEAEPDPTVPSPSPKAGQTSPASGSPRATTPTPPDRRQEPPDTVS
jgi:hypothetical protein